MHGTLLCYLLKREARDRFYTRVNSLSIVGDKERVSKTCNHRVLWENGASKVTNIFNAWKDILSVIRASKGDTTRTILLAVTPRILSKRSGSKL